MRITKARKIGDKDHNKYLEESQQLVTIYSGQLLALLLMNGFNTCQQPHCIGIATQLVRSFQKLSSRIFWRWTFDLVWQAGLSVSNLGGFYGTFAISENAGISQEKGPFVHQPTFWIKFGAPMNRNFMKGVGWWHHLGGGETSFNGEG